MVIKYFSFPGIAGVHCAFCGRSRAGGRLGGNISFNCADDPSQVRQNRAGLLATLKKQGLTGWHEMRQAHGTAILAEPRATSQDIDSDQLNAADGAMTSQPGLGLVIKTADCQPILLADSSGRRIMALHCGWRGNRANFPGLAVRRFCSQYGLSPQDVHAVRGPSLGPEQAQFINFSSEWGPQFAKWLHGDKMDLWQLTADQLQAAGVPANQIHGIDICTVTNQQDWFSHRADHAAGRQASIIWIAAAGQEEEA